MDVKKRQKLRKFLKELEGIRGRHTELVSVYVPAGYELIKIIQHFQQEQKFDHIYTILFVSALGVQYSKL